MTQITQDDVQKLAQLSGLQLGDNEAVTLTADIERILEYFQQLEELDTSSVEPTYQVTGLQNVSRGDVVASDLLPREQLIQLSEGGVLDNQVKVPKVL